TLPLLARRCNSPAVQSLRGRLSESWAAMRGVYTNPNLRRIQLGGAGSTIGLYAYGVAIAVYAYGQGGAIAVGVVTAIRQLIAAGIAPFSATLADRLPRERVMLASDLGRLCTVRVTTPLVLLDGPALAVYA